MAFLLEVSDGLGIEHCTKLPYVLNTCSAKLNLFRKSTTVPCKPVKVSLLNGYITRWSFSRALAFGLAGTGTPLIVLRVSSNDCSPFLQPSMHFCTELASVPIKDEELR